MPTVFGTVLNGIGEFWKEFRQFAYDNRTVLEAMFILLYAIEQIGLILLIDMYPAFRTIIISLFAVIVLTTFSLHKLVMESRIRLLEQQLSVVPIQINMLNTELQEIAKRYNELAYAYNQVLSEKQNLNKRKPEGGLAR